MEIFKDAPTTYKVRKNAVKKAEQVEERLLQIGVERIHWVIGSNDEGRYFPIFIGTETFEAIHMGVCVAA